MSDPLTLASAFATIVQLLTIFKHERGDKASSDHQQFMEWLAHHRHEELKEFIANSAAARAEVDNLLRQDNALILEKLDGINACVVSIAANISEFRGLASAIAPGMGFSEQAIDICVSLFVQMRGVLCWCLPGRCAAAMSISLKAFPAW